MFLEAIKVTHKSASFKWFGFDMTGLSDDHYTQDVQACLTGQNIIWI